MSRHKQQYANYISLKIIEKLGNMEPSEEQIAFIESLLMQITIFEPISFEGKLTNRERACLYFSALGKTSAETAKLLNIQPSTVEKHRKGVKQKLGCRSMAEAVFRGIQFGYVQPKIKGRA